MMNEPESNPSSGSIPVIGRILLLLLAMVVGLLIGQLIGVGVAEMAGMGSDVLTDPSWKPETAFERNMYRTVTMIGHLFAFLVPGLLFAWFTYRKDWLGAIRVTRQPGLWLLFSGALWIMVAAPIVQYVYTLNQSIPLPEWAQQLEGTANDLIQALLVMDSPIEFMFTLVVMALLPALGEELIFRGLIQGTLQRSGNPHTAILIAALIFSSFHLQFEGFLPRALLGILLGYLFYWSNNLWLPVFAHFVYNGLQVVAAYFYPEMIKEAVEGDLNTGIETWQLFLSLVMTFLFGFYLYRLTSISTGSDAGPPRDSDQ